MAVFPELKQASLTELSGLAAGLSDDDLCLAVDSGGTKTSAILYTAGFRKAAAAKCGSLRSATTPQELVSADLSRLLEGLGLTKDPGAAPKLITGAFDHHAANALRGIFPDAKILRLGEMVLGFSSSRLFGNGILALSGTGCTIYSRINGISDSLGGYGSLISDEGSGYWISRAALGAAIKDHEGRGPFTALTAAAAAHFGGLPRSDLRSALFRIYSQNNTSPVGTIAGFVPAVVKAASEGDPVADKILSDAGVAVAEQVISLIRKNDLPKDLPLTISGSVWKKNPVYLHTFRERLLSEGVAGPFVFPRFEPVCGAMVAQLFAKYGDSERLGESLAVLENDFREFVIHDDAWT
ncbi:MAG: hypothetical protein IKX06_04670 [Clostridia bacterium]|nr:hypothetical protein [Clostridia bacterium]